MVTPLTTPASLESYLNFHSTPFTSITLLTGGTANYVYRVTLPSTNQNPSSSSNQSLIYKHAAPHIHSNPSFSFPVERMDYESTILRRLHQPLSTVLPESLVKPVEWLGYDADAKLLKIGDGGERNLKVAYVDPELDIEVVGAELGGWIAALHVAGRSVSLNPNDEKDVRHNNPIAVNVYRHSYANLAGALEAFGEDRKFREWVNEEYGSKLATESEVLCHGDFWPGNVLVKAGKDGLKRPELTVVDWEMTRRGSSATDVAQFAAEAFLLDRFCGGRGLRAAFLRAYVEAKGEEGVNREWVKRFVAHWGTHVAYWPTVVEWASREETEKLVKIGVGTIKTAEEGNWEKLGKSELFESVDDIFKQYWDVA